MRVFTIGAITVLAMAWTATNTAIAAVADSTSLDDEIEALRREIAELRADLGGGATWLNESRQAEMRALVEEVLQDAELRTSSSFGSDLAGWHGGYRLASPDGDFVLRISGLVQVRFVMNDRRGDQPLPANPPGTIWGFENRRTQIRLDGHVVDPGWRWMVQAVVPNVNGTVVLQQGWIERDLGDGVSLTVGQFRPPYLREESIPAGLQLGADRSIVNAYFNQGFCQGARLTAVSDRVRGSIWAGDGVGPVARGPAGLNSINTSWERTPARFSVTGRCEWKPLGTWAQFNSFSSPPGEDPGVLIGVAGMGQRAGDNRPLVDGQRMYGVTGDITVALGGASLYSMVVWQRTETPGAATSTPFGFLLQGGYYLSEDLEAFAAYGIVDHDSPLPGSSRVGRFNGFTVGCNRFFGDSVKLTLDWTIDFQSLEAGALVANGVGFRLDEAGQRLQWALRAQVQLTF